MDAAQRGTCRLTEDRLDLLLSCSFDPVSRVLLSTAQQAEPLEGTMDSRRDRDHPDLKCCATDHGSALPRHLTPVLAMFCVSSAWPLPTRRGSPHD
jgi:hypothetical protein